MSDNPEPTTVEELFEELQKQFVLRMVHHAEYEQWQSTLEILRKHEPKQPIYVLSPAGYLEYLEDVRTYEINKGILKDKVKEVFKLYVQAEKVITRLLPMKNAWFKFTHETKEYGVAVVYDSWGGTHPVVVVADWETAKTSGRPKNHDYYP